MASKRETTDFGTGKERLDEIEKRLKNLFGNSSGQSSGGGVFSGLGNLIGAVTELAKKAEASGGKTHQSGEFGNEQGVRGMWGFTFKTGLGQEDATIEPFGNVKRDEQSGEVRVEPVREPVVDVFDEHDRVQVVAELPGVVQEDVQLILHDDILELSAKRGEATYQKEILLPGNFAADKMSFSCRNGILEVTLMKE